MGFTSRDTFTGGWMPDADPTNAPETALLRMDNLVLDERDLPALRMGSTKINSSPFADTDIHSLFTTALSGTRYRMSGAGNAVYANGSSILSGIAGSNDIAFGYHLGQILFARSTTKKKYDGTTVRNWGIAMTGAKPNPVETPADGKTFADGVGADTWTALEGAVAVVGPIAGHTMIGVETATGPSFRAVCEKVFTTPQDFTTYNNGTRGNDDDIISWLFGTALLADIRGFAVQIDVNDGKFADDYYMTPVYDGKLSDGTTIDPNAGDEIPGGGAMGAAARAAFAKAFKVGPSFGVTTVGFPSGAVSSTSTLQPFRMNLKRGDFTRIGKLTNGKGWQTVKAVRLIVQGRDDVALTKYNILFGECRITSARLLGDVQWRYVYVRNASGYLAKSGPSPVSDIQTFNSHAAVITVPGDGSRDSQVNEIWLYRKDKDMDQFYRTVVQTVSGTGAVAITDTQLSEDVLTINQKLEIDNTTPPDNIIGIAGPHFERTLVLTSDGKLWPSRKLDPDAFATGQAISVGGADETPYWIFRAHQTVYIGTSKDIYVLEGTGAENPDGSIDYILRQVSMDHRPLNAGVAHEGDQLVFFSDDGWRGMQGSGSSLLTGNTSLLYRGQTRHGVSAVNVAGGRFRAALGKGQLVAITPEGASTTSSNVLYRHVFARGLWYRHTYHQSGNWRSIHREPDGTLIAGDDAGTVWILDTGTQDNDCPLPIVLWTKVDAFGMPYQRKVFGDLMWRSDTGGAATSIAIHRDGSASSATSVTATQTGMGVDAYDLGNADSLHKLVICTHLQFRVTGSVSAYHLYDFGIQFRERPIPLIGRVVDSRAGSPGVKVFSGYVLTCNTKGEARTITPYLDGVADTQTFDVTTSLEELETETLRFTLNGRRATDIGFAVDGEIEIVDWSPIVTQRQPVGVLVWDSGPIDLGDKELVWLRELQLKVRAGADLVVTPYFDGTAFQQVTIAVTANVDSVYRIPVGRAYVGRQPRLVVTSCEPFFPYWIEATRRTTGSASQKGKVRVPFTLETGA